MGASTAEKSSTPKIKKTKPGDIEQARAKASKSGAPEYPSIVRSIIASKDHSMHVDEDDEETRQPSKRRKSGGGGSRRSSAQFKSPELIPDDVDDAAGNDEDMDDDEFHPAQDKPVTGEKEPESTNKQVTAKSDEDKIRKREARKASKLLKQTRRDELVAFIDSRKKPPIPDAEDEFVRESSFVEAKPPAKETSIWGEYTCVSDLRIVFGSDNDILADISKSIGEAAVKAGKTIPSEQSRREEAVESLGKMFKHKDSSGKTMRLFAITVAGDPTDRSLQQSLVQKLDWVLVDQGYKVVSHANSSQSVWTMMSVSVNDSGETPLDNVDVLTSIKSLHALVIRPMHFKPSKIRFARIIRYDPETRTEGGKIQISPDAIQQAVEKNALDIKPINFSWTYSSNRESAKNSITMAYEHQLGHRPDSIGKMFKVLNESFRMMDIKPCRICRGHNHSSVPTTECPVNQLKAGTRSLNWNAAGAVEKTSRKKLKTSRGGNQNVENWT